MNNGTLLICPNCSPKEIARHGTYWSFGSISPNGAIIVRRKGDVVNNSKLWQRTIIFSQEFTVACSCGYSIYYNNGKISVGELPASYNYERNSNSLR